MIYTEDLEKYKNQKGNYNINRKIYYIGICKRCGKRCLLRKENSFCSYSCSKTNEKHTIKTKEKISLSKIGKKLSKYHREKISGKNHPNWKGGIVELNIPLYDTYTHKLEPIEQCRKTDDGYLEVKCAYCGNGMFLREQILIIEYKL